MLQYISSSSWSPKRSHQPWLKKERKTLSKMNIAQSINFPIPSSTAGSQAIKSPHSGNTSTDRPSSHPQFFPNFLLWAGGRLWSNKNHFYLQINLEIKFSQTKGWSVLQYFAHCIGWADQQLSVHYCPLLASYRKKYSESIYVNIYSIKWEFTKNLLRSKIENTWEIPSWSHKKQSWQLSHQGIYFNIFVVLNVCLIPFLFAIPDKYPRFWKKERVIVLAEMTVIT